MGATAQGRQLGRGPMRGANSAWLALEDLNWSGNRLACARNYERLDLPGEERAPPPMGRPSEPHLGTWMDARVRTRWRMSAGTPALRREPVSPSPPCDTARRARLRHLSFRSTGERSLSTLPPIFCSTKDHVDTVGYPARTAFLAKTLPTQCARVQLAFISAHLPPPHASTPSTSARVSSSVHCRCSFLSLGAAPVKSTVTRWPLAYSAQSTCR